MDDEMEGLVACEFCEGWFDSADLIDGMCLDCGFDPDEPQEAL